MKYTNIKNIKNLQRHKLKQYHSVLMDQGPCHKLR